MTYTEQRPNDFSVPASVWERPAFDARKAAIVIVDMVNWNVPRTPNSSGLAPAYYVERLAKMVIPNHQRLLNACREAGVTVVFLRVGCSRPDYGDGLAVMRGAFKSNQARDGMPACDVIAELFQEGDLSLLKTGSGGFNSSALDIHLRNMGIVHVLYTGVITNACVLLTVAAGFDLGYSGHLVSDATATFSQELQDQAENLIGQFMAQIATTDEMVKLLSASVGLGRNRRDPSAWPASSKDRWNPS
jgi:biuret amidohydrolase